MAAGRVENFVTPETYLEIDRAAEIRSEYFSGEMVAMSGASDPHELLVVNLCVELR